MSAVHRTPTDAEVIRHGNYGDPYPDPLDLLVELVTARSLHGPTRLSDREITNRLRLRSTDDALRLVKQGQAAGRLAVDQDSTIRRLSIPFAAIQPETAPRAAIEAVRAALPPPPPEPVAPKAQAAPFVAKPTREIGPRAAAPATAPTTPPDVPALSEETEAVKPNVVMHINVPRDLHARLKEISQRDGTPMNQIAIDAVTAGLNGPPPAPAPAIVQADPPAAAPSPEQPVAVIGEYGSIRVPLALFDAAGKAGMSVPVFVEEVISFGLRHFVAREYRAAQ